MRILKSILAVVAGMVSGGLAVALLEGVSSVMHPMPEGLDLNDPAQIGEWVRQLPTSAYLVVLLAWIAGSFVGTWVARKLTPNGGVVPGLLVCVLFVVATIFNLLQIPHPGWMGLVAIPAMVAAGGLALLWSTPKSFAVVATRTIQAPLASVFETLTSPEIYKQAVPDIKSVEFLSEKHTGVGARFREVRECRGREAATELSVTEWSPNERVRMVAAEGGCEWDTVFEVRENAGTVHMDMHMDARPLTVMAKLMTPFMLGVISRAIESDMDAVKRWCEAQGAPGPESDASASLQH